MRRRILFFAAVAALLAMSFGGQLMLRARRTAAAPVMAEGAFAALGGLRAIAAEVVWFRADRLQDEGRYVELAQLASALTFMEPHTPEVWSHAAWNLAYNVSVMMATHEDRWRWVLAAIKLLRDEGLAYNPRSPELCRELAWMFELKIGTDIDAAARLYRERWRELVEAVAARNAWEELKMDRAVMAMIERVYGLEDRGSPFYSAIYWAHLGICSATSKEDRSFLAEILRQSVTLYRNRQQH